LLTILVLIILIIAIIPRKGSGEAAISAKVLKGPLEITVETTGELEAKNSVEIWGPTGLNSVRIWDEIKLSKLIPEGSEVKKGDFVAQLDQSVVEEKISNARLEIERFNLELSRTRIDTALELQSARNNLENLLSAKIERELELQKSQYEPPVTIRQAEVSLEKSNRDFLQAEKEYILKYEKAKATIRTSMIRLEKEQKDFELLEKIMGQFTILAPDNGMVIYRRNWNGNRIQEGSMISPWNPIVAELPDMTTMLSKTFVNEVDIRKIAIDQEADITFDAFPEKKMKGVVVTVANVGESLKNSDAKVFRVDIEVKGIDADLRPAMTTGNKIITKNYSEALYLPIETVFGQGDSLYYVYLISKFSAIKKQVLIGERNSQYVIITSGLAEKDEVRFTPPEDADEMEIEFLEKSLDLVKNEK